MNLSTLEQYVEQKNAWGKIFGTKPVSLLTPAGRQYIADCLCNDLSPENLTCDGEVRGRALQTKYNYLTRCQQELLSIDSTLVMEY